MQHRICYAALVIFPVGALAATEIDDFEGGDNGAGWSFIAGGDVLEPAGGNPDTWLHQPTYDTFAPTLKSLFGAATPFHGDYSAAGVTSIGVDARTLGNDFGTAGYNFVLLLLDTNGTPANFNDDDFTYFVLPQIPQPADGWVHFEVPIPSQSMDAVPAGWSGGFSGDPENFRPGVDFGDVIASVDRVEFRWLHPAFFAIFQQWDVGADNLSITMADQTDPIPTVSTWGLAAMTLVLLVAATVVFRHVRVA